jgi:hypothetical protein
MKDVQEKLPALEREHPAPVLRIRIVYLGSRIRMRIKEFRYLNPKKVEKNWYQVLKLTSRIFIPDPGSGFFPSTIPDPGDKIRPDPGSGSASLGTSNHEILVLSDTKILQILPVGFILLLQWEGNRVGAPHFN